MWKYSTNAGNRSEPRVRIAFDTNVLVSALASPDARRSSYRLVELASEGKVTGYTSVALLEEFKEIMQRDFQTPIERVEQMVGVFLGFLKLVKPVEVINAVKEDPDDDRVLECAVAANAIYVASWDPHLTNLAEYDGIKIMNPGKLLHELKEAHRID